MNLLSGVQQHGIRFVETAVLPKQKTVLFQQLKAEAKEGVVFKACEAPYTSGRPNTGGNANWSGNATAKFEYRKHLPSLEGAEQAEKDRAVREEPQEVMRTKFEACYKRTEAVFKDPRVLNVNLNAAPGVISSEDGRLRIVSWDTQTGGTMHEYCLMAQFKSPDGKAGFALLDYSGEWENADRGKQPAIFGSCSGGGS